MEKKSPSWYFDNLIVFSLSYKKTWNPGSKIHSITEKNETCETSYILSLQINSDGKFRASKAQKKIHI